MYYHETLLCLRRAGASPPSSIQPDQLGTIGMAWKLDWFSVHDSEHHDPNSRIVEMLVISNSSHRFKFVPRGPTRSLR